MAIPIDPISSPNTKAITIISNITEVTDKTFDAEVLQSQKPVLVLFSTAWCPACKQQLAILEEVARDYKDKIKFVKVDVENNLLALATYQVSHVPKLILFQAGKAIDTKIGLHPNSSIREIIRNNIN